MTDITPERLPIEQKHVVAYTAYTPKHSVLTIRVLGFRI